MRLKLKTAPTVEPVTLEEAKLHLKVDSGDDNALITALITTARELAERETKRAFITQTWEMILDVAPHIIEIPKPPLQSAGISIKVLDSVGEESLVDPDNYMIDASQNSYGRIMPILGSTWPYHRGFASFIVEFKAGYGNAATDVPEALKQAILMVLGHLYENRGGEGAVKARVQAIEEARILWWPFKILRI